MGIDLGWECSRHSGTRALAAAAPASLATRRKGDGRKRRSRSRARCSIRDTLALCLSCARAVCVRTVCDASLLASRSLALSLSRSLARTLVVSALKVPSLLLLLSAAAAAARSLALVHALTRARGGRQTASAAAPPAAAAHVGNGYQKGRKRGERNSLLLCGVRGRSIGGLPLARDDRRQGDPFSVARSLSRLSWSLCSQLSLLISVRARAHRQLSLSLSLSVSLAVPRAGLRRRHEARATYSSQCPAGQPAAFHASTSSLRAKRPLMRGRMSAYALRLW